MTKARELSDYTGLAADITAGDTAARAGRKNLIINGGFDVWQRGTSFTGASPYYSTDRWQAYRGGAVAGMTLSRQDNHSNISTYYARSQRDSGNTSTAVILLATSLETINNYSLLSKEITLSFRSLAGGDFSGGTITAEITAGTGTNGSHANGFTGQSAVGTVTVAPNATFGTGVHTLTVTMPANATQVSANIRWTPTGTAGANDWVGITNVQLELGSVATDFEHRSYGEELALCQRFYQDSGFIKYYMSGRWAASTGGSIGWWKWAVPLRAAPSVTTSGTWSTGYTYGGTPIFANMTTVGTIIQTSGITFPANTVMYFNNGNILADAEL